MAQCSLEYQIERLPIGMIDTNTSPVWLCCNDNTTGTNHTRHLAQGRLRVIKMHQDTFTMRRIKNTIVKRQAIGICLLDRNDGTQPCRSYLGASLQNKGLSLINSHNLASSPHLLCQSGKKYAITAPYFQYSLARLQMKQLHRVASYLLQKACR